MKQIVLLAFLFQFINVSAQTLVGKVISVADGDTFTIIDGLKKKTKIRLYGIDCPEKKQDFGTAAKKFTANKCFSKVVHVHTKNKDKYGRTLGIVTLPDNSELNLLLLINGLAWHYKRFDNTAKYAKAEAAARNQKKGIWNTVNPIAPWDFRKKIMAK